MYVLFGVVLTAYATNGTLDRIVLLLGEKTKSTAAVAADNYSITDADVEKLMALEFEDAPYHPANICLADMFADLSEDRTLQNAYLIKVVDEDEIILYQNGQAAISPPEDDHHRVATGLVPLYTDEGNFVGMLGVDIDMEAFEEGIKNVQIFLSLVFFLPSLALAGLLIAMYLRSRKRLHIEVYTDGLTSIKNRKYINTFFPEIVSDHYKQINPLSVIMIDVDCFKQFNDHYGHQEGDKALVEISAAISATLRKSDILCRYGGEELMVILSNSDTHDAERVAKRIQRAVMNLAIKHDASTVSDVVTVSQGVFTAIPGKTDSGKDFIKHADKVLYEAKKTGRNRYITTTTESCPA